MRATPIAASGKAKNTFELSAKLFLLLNTVDGLNSLALPVKNYEDRVGNVMTQGEGLTFGGLQVRHNKDGMVLKLGYERVHDPL